MGDPNTKWPRDLSVIAGVIEVVAIIPGKPIEIGVIA
jgi:hypothetical protein